MPTLEFHIGESHDHLLLSKFSINDFTGEQLAEIINKVSNLALKSSVKFRVWFTDKFPNRPFNEATEDDKVQWVMEKHSKQWNEWIKFENVLPGGEEKVSENGPTEPEFQKHFNGNSIGIEAELTGVSVEFDQNAASREFGYVADLVGNKLFKLTKDMSIEQLGTKKRHTIELVSNPIEMSDMERVGKVKNAMLWFHEELNRHIKSNPGKPLSDQKNEGKGFKMVITSENHAINANSVDQPRVIMGKSGMQVTVGVKAKDFGTSSSSVIEFIESASWYQKDLKKQFDPKVKVDNLATSQNVFAYLGSVVLNTARLMQDGLDLLSPDTKNKWEILPRTNPATILSLLSSNDTRIVCEQIKKLLSKKDYSNNAYDYIITSKGELVGHGVNDATIGKDHDQALLFEFRKDLPKELETYLPAEQFFIHSSEKPLDKFSHTQRKEIINKARELALEYRAKFLPWFSNKFPDRSFNQATNDDKVQWVMEKHSDKWKEWTNFENVSPGKKVSQDGGNVFGSGARDDSGRNAGSGQDIKEELEDLSRNFMPAEPDFWNKDFQATFEIKINDASKINTLKELLISCFNLKHNEDSAFNPDIRFKGEVIEIGHSYEVFYSFLSGNDPLKKNFPPLRHGPYAEKKRKNHEDIYGDYETEIVPIDRNLNPTVGKELEFNQPNRNLSTRKNEKLKLEISKNIQHDKIIDTLSTKASESMTPLRLLVVDREKGEAYLNVLKNLKGKILGLSGLFSEIHQDLLDKWLNAPLETPMPLELKVISEKLNYAKIMACAKERGVQRIIALDTEHSLSSSSADQADIISSNIIESALRDNKADFIGLVEYERIHNSRNLDSRIGANTLLLTTSKLPDEIISKSKYTDGLFESNLDFILKINHYDENDHYVFDTKGNKICSNRYNPSFEEEKNNYLVKGDPDGFKIPIQKNVNKDDLVSYIAKRANDENKDLRLIVGEKHSDDSARRSILKAIESGDIKTLVLEHFDHNEFQKLLDQWIKSGNHEQMDGHLSRRLNQLDNNLAGDSGVTIRDLLNAAKIQKVKVYAIDTEAVKTSADFKPDPQHTQRGNNMNYIAAKILEHYRVKSFVALVGAGHATSVLDQDNNIKCKGLDRLTGAMSLSFLGTESAPKGVDFVVNPEIRIDNNLYIKPDVAIHWDRAIDKGSYIGTDKSDHDLSNSEEYEEYENVEEIIRKKNIKAAHQSSEYYAKSLFKQFLDKSQGQVRTEAIGQKLEEIINLKVQNSKQGKSLLAAAEKLKDAVAKMSFIISKEGKQILQKEIILSLDTIINKIKNPSIKEDSDFSDIRTGDKSSIDSLEKTYNAFNRQNFGDGRQNGPDVEGRCYALAAMAASALKEGGSKRLYQLINNLDRIYSSADADMVDLKKAIDKFHQYANDAFAVKKEDLLFTLDTICDTIGKVDASAQYKLGTLNLQSGLGHAMMVGVDVTSEGKKFYFFDPTSRDTYIQHDDINQFKASLIEKLSLDVNDVKQYNFEFKAFDTTSFLHTPISLSDGALVGLDTFSVQNIGQVVNDIRSHTAENKKVMGVLKRDGVIASDYSIGNSLRYLDLDYIVSKERSVLQKIQQANAALKESYIPAYALMRETSDGGLSVPFYDSNLKDRVFVTIDNSHRNLDLINDVKNLHSTYKKNAKRVGQSKHKWAQAVMQFEDITDYFAIANQWRATIFGNIYTPQEEASVLLNNYISKAQLGVGTTQVLSEGLLQAHKYLSKARPSLPGLNNLGKLGKGMGRALPVIGLGLETALLGVSIYDFTRAETNLQKAQAATNIGLGIAGVGVTGTVIIASAFGSILVAGAATGVGLLLIPIGAGVGAIFEYYQDMESADQTYKYIGSITRAYDQGFVLKECTLYSEYGAVVKKIDLRAGDKCIYFGSQTVESQKTERAWGDSSGDRYRHGSDGNTEKNVLFADSKKSIQGAVTTLVLPMTANQNLKYVYNDGNLDASNLDADGRRTMETLAKKGVANSYYYLGGSTDREKKVAVSAYGIRPESMSDTCIEVFLDKEVKNLYTPKLTDKLAHNKLTYALEGDGGQYTLTLADKVKFALSENTNTSSTWILNASELVEEDNIQIETNKLIIGGVEIDVSKLAATSKLIIQRQNGDVCTIDLKSQTKTLYQISGQVYEKHKNDLTRNGMYTLPTAEEGQYLLIKNYQHGGQNSGNAYVNIQSKQMLFAAPVSDTHPTPVVEVMNLLDKIVNAATLYEVISNAQEGSRWNKNWVSYRALGSTYTLKELRCKDICDLENAIQNQAFQELHPSLYEGIKRWLDDYDTNTEKITEFMNQISSQWSSDLVIKTLSEVLIDADEFFQKDWITKKGWTAGNDIRQQHRVLTSLRDTIQQKNNSLLQGAVLGMVDGDGAYWYNLQEGLIWKTDSKTGKIKVQYQWGSKIDQSDQHNQPFEWWALSKVQFFKANGQVYINLDTQTRLDTSYATRNTYQLGENSMELIRFSTQESTHTPEGKFLNRTPFKFADVPLIENTYSGLVYCFDGLSPKESYWIRDGKDYIVANLPSSDDYTEVMKSLVCLGGVSLSGQNTEMLYFYDPKNKKLYKQEGLLGPNPLGNSFKAKSIIDKKIENAYLKDNAVWFTTEEGLTYLLVDDGKLEPSVGAINETWLKAQGNNWLQNLHTLLGNTDHRISINGLQSLEEGGRVHVFYQTGNLTVLDLGTLDFVGFDETNTIAYLFNAKTGKLYTQEVVNQKDFVGTLNTYPIGDGFPAKKEVLSELTLESVSALGNEQFRLVTKAENQANYQKEAVLQWDTKTNKLYFQALDPECVNSVGVNNHAERFIKSLLDTHTDWIVNEVILVPGENMPARWFHKLLGRMVGETQVNYKGVAPTGYIGIVKGVTTTGSPTIQVFFQRGNEGHHVETYYFNGEHYTDGNIYYYVEHLERLDNKTLLIKGYGENSHFVPPLIEGVEHVILQPSDLASKKTYKIADVLKGEVKSVIIDHCKSGSTVDDDLLMSISKTTKFGYYEDHLTIVDEKGTILIRNVFGADKQNYNRLKISTEINGQSYTKTISEVVDRWEQAKSLTGHHDFYQLEDFFVKDILVYQQDGKTLDIIGNHADNVLEGSELINKLRGLLGMDTLRGYAGNDYLDGGDGDDTYLFANGDGHDIIVDSGGVDTIKFLFDLQQEQLKLKKDVDDLKIYYSNNDQDSITIKQYFVAGHAVENIMFNDNQKLDINAWLVAG